MSWGFFFYYYYYYQRTLLHANILNIYNLRNTRMEHREMIFLLRFLDFSYIHYILFCKAINAFDTVTPFISSSNENFKCLTNR